ncbi:MAG TPA: DUF3035 domain-containing protein [Alphaproteobacteria bacterium]|nr:DUF3035 domain-containing protein [Alphaproteobacteria bacterium]
MKPCIAGRRPVALAPCLVLLASLALSGCGDARKALGFEKAPPDEFRIVSRAPLSLPPDYALRPPQPGAARPQEQTSPQQARQALLGAGGAPVRPAAPEGASPGEAALLAKVGTPRTDPRIRELVDRESTALAEADRTFFDRLVFWQKPPEPGTVVDPQREAQRLRENQALGRAATEGETPTIRRRRKGALEGIF